MKTRNITPPDFLESKRTTGLHRGLAVARSLNVLTLSFAISALAEDSQFTFDPNGNLLTESPDLVAPPQILSQPPPQVVGPGELASFFVVVADSRALSYQWRFNDANISGATNETLLLTNVGATNEGQYSVVLVNPSGSVTSAPAALMIDSDLDHMADSWELANFGNLNQYGSRDSDGDGVSDLQEFLDGTSPTNGTSALFRLTVLSDGGTVSVSPNRLSYTNGEIATVTVTLNSGEKFQGWTGAAIGTNNPLTLLMTNNRSLFAHFGSYPITWTNGASGNWHAPINWSPNLVPNEDDDVAIPGAATFTLNDDAQCRDLSLHSSPVNFNGPGALMLSSSTLSSGMTLGGSSGLTVLSGFNWSGGTMSGTGRTIIAPGATLNISGSAVHFLSGGRTLENGGTILWSGGFLTMGGATITNRTGALFDNQTAVTVNAGGVNRFDNAGTFRKSVNAGTATWPVTFNNSGLVEIGTGRLALDGAGTNTSTIEIAAGASLNLSSGGVAFISTAGSSISGAGDFIVSGNATLSGLVNPGGTHTFSAGNANLNGNYICTNSPATISSGTVNFNSTSAVDVVNYTSGTLSGSGILNVLQTMNWSGGNMGGSGRTVIAPGATLNFNSGAAVTINTRTLENGGTVIWSGAGNLTGSSAVITNRPGALFELRNNATFAPQGFQPWRFDNAGTFRKAMATGTSTFASGVSLNNYNTVEIRSGRLAANGGYTSRSNALLNCAIGGTTAGTGFGQLQVAGTVNVNGSLSVDLINGFVPATNNSFTVLTAGTRNGSFANFFYPSNAMIMQLSNTANSVVVRVTDVFTNAPAPMLMMPELSGSNVTLTWTAISNTTYRLEFNPDLNSSNWMALPGDMTALSNRASRVDMLTPSNRFYRIRVSP